MNLISQMQTINTKIDFIENFSLDIDDANITRERTLSKQDESKKYPSNPFIIDLEIDELLRKRSFSNSIGADSISPKKL